MILKSVVSKQLAHFSYLLGDEDAGVAVIIDPRRDIDDYLSHLTDNALDLTAIIETHIQADYVSGARELAMRTGAPIYMGAKAECAFEFLPLSEGDVIEVGAYTLTVMETPGHTPEHITLILDSGEGPWAVFSGDSLFAGEVGRPDLLGDGMEEMLITQLYHTIHEKILKLDDGMIVFPGHGKGSPCGARIGDKPFTTIGFERQHTPALQPMDKDSFKALVRGALTPAPKYYTRVKGLNCAEEAPVTTIPHPALISPREVEASLSGDDTILLDVRASAEFTGGFIPGSIFIGEERVFPIWVGRMLDPMKEIILILSDPADADSVITRLRRVGFDRIRGILRGGIDGWIQFGGVIQHPTQISAREFMARDLTQIQLLDVRGKHQYKEENIDGAKNIPLPALERRLTELDQEKPLILYCNTGFQSSIAASYLERAGFSDVAILTGGITSLNLIR